jgi:VCBS repeat-containing protein
VTITNDGISKNKTQFTISASPVEFGAAGLMPADRIKGSENGMVGAIIVEPQDSCWIADPGTRAQATVWKGATDGLGASVIGQCGIIPVGSTDSFRDFVTIMQNDVNMRYGGIVQVLDATGAVVETIDCGDRGDTNDPTQPDQIARMECAVPNIAAEGALGPTEESQDSGQKAINYKSDPMWFRMGVVPDFFQIIHRDTALKDIIPQAYSNFLDLGNGLGVVGDPQTQIFNASPDGPQYGRMRVLMPGGHARGVTYTLHGHQWQSQPYINDSSEIGDRSTTGIKSEYYGAQEGINPTGHWDFVVDLGGPFDVAGDYLWRDQAAFGSFQGLWGLLRFDQTAPVAVDIVRSVPKFVLVDQLTSTYAPGSVELDLLALAFDLDGFDPATSIVEITQPNFGTVSPPVSGVVTYTYPDWPFAWPCAADALLCPATFTYTVSDADGNVSAPGTVTINITNSAPVANNDTVQIDADGVVNVAVPVLTNDTDAEGDLARIPLTVIKVNEPVDQNGVAAGTASLNGDNTFQYDNTDPNFQGVVRFGYTVEDESGAVSNSGIVRVAIRVDSIVITSAQFQEVNGKWTIDGTCSVAGNTIDIFTGMSIEEGTRGELVGSTICAADNTFLFSNTSTVTAPGREQLNYVSALSSGLGFDEAFPLRFAGQNNAPVANPNAYTIDEDTELVDATPGPVGIGLLANDLDADFDTLTAVLVSGPAHGKLNLNADGSFSYMPDADWNSYDGCSPATTPCADSFTYQADDGQDVSNEATVTITVNAVNDVPTAVDDIYVTALNTQLNVTAPGVLGNDFDAEGDTYTLDTNLVSGPAAGNSVVLNADGSFTYTPDALFSGTDAFQYRICEDLLDEATCGTGTVTINVGVNTAPVALDDAGTAEQTTATQTTPATGNVLDNDSDADNIAPTAPNAGLTAVPVTGPANGTLTLDPDGSYTYTPTLNFVGTDSFTYVANDGLVDSNVATVTITVIDRVTITSAEYRTRQGRWNVQGTVSIPSSTITLYLNNYDPNNPATDVLGTANVDPISGAWGLNSTTGPVANQNDTVIAVSSQGGEAAAVVRVRR